jgi:DNA-binding NarL/FixJ family response regulator
MSIKVLLADDHRVVREEIRMLIELQPDLVVIGEAVDGDDAVQQVIQYSPDVAVMDLSMPNQDGLQAARRICELNPTTQIVILSMHVATEFVIQALQIGIQGYVLKEMAGTELVDAIRSAHAYSRYLSPKLLYNLGDGYIGSMLTCH